MRVAGVTLVAVLVVSGAACGGGPTTHAGFARDAGHICRDANRRFVRVDIVNPSAAGAEAALEDIIEIGGSAIGDLRKVKPPKGFATEVSAWLGALEQALDEVDYARELLRDDEIVRAVAAIDRADVLTRRARHLGRALGVARVCDVPELLPDR